LEGLEKEGTETRMPDLDERNAVMVDSGSLWVCQAPEPKTRGGASRSRTDETQRTRSASPKNPRLADRRDDGIHLRSIGDDCDVHDDFEVPSRGVIDIDTGPVLSVEKVLSAETSPAVPDLPDTLPVICLDMWGCTGLVVPEGVRASSFSSFVIASFCNLPESTSVFPKETRTATVHHTRHPVFASSHWFKPTGEGIIKDKVKIRLEAWNWNATEGHFFLGSVEVPWKSKVGTRHYQLPLQGTSGQPVAGFLTCSTHVLPKAGAAIPKRKKGYVEKSESHHAWTGTVTLGAEAACVSSMVTAKGFEFYNVDVELTVPTRMAGSGSEEVPEFDTWKSTTLSHVMDLKKALHWKEKHPFKYNFLGTGPPAGLSIQIKITVLAVRTGKSLVGYAHLSLQDALDHAGSAHNIPFKSVGDDEFSGTIDLSCAWKPPFLNEEASSFLSKLHHGSNELTKDSGTVQCVTEYATAIHLWRGVASHEHEAMVESKTKEHAGLLTYHFWSPAKICTMIVKREHGVVKLFKRVAPLTRTERYAAMSSAMQMAFFVQTMMFNPKCTMVPRPAGCKPPGSMLKKFLPSQATVVASIVGLCFAVPVPLSIITCFRKPPIQETLSPAEKRAKMFSWRVTQAIGWCWVLFFNLVVSFWLIRFASEYDMPVFQKWANAGYQSLVHRFLTAPIGRAVVVAGFVVASKTCAGLDFCFVCFPHLLPTGQPRIPRNALDKDGNRIGGQEEEEEDEDDIGDIGGD